MTKLRACLVVGFLSIGSLSLSVDARRATPQVPDSGDRVVLVTLDGARTEEVFGGLDTDVLKTTLREKQTLDDLAVYKRFNAPSTEERRRRLMPFFWTLVSEQGSIAGNRRLGSSVQLGNRHWFSYPGYAEILLGEPHDAAIKSNDPIRNPYPTVFERIRERLSLPREQVATFASWSVFNAIAEHVEGSTFVNAGMEALDSTQEGIAMANQLQREAATPWDGTRFDAFTFRLAMAHLAAARPRVLYLAFDETDDWAHDGRYDRVLETYARIDGFLQELWNWLQSQPDYRGRTSLLLTTDHGRGHTLQDWRNHGAKVEGAQDVWIAFVSPRMSRRGEWRDAPPLSTSQIAATLASWMDVDWTADHPNAGQPIR
jgi:Type I phosphodiesterase / nucleotide pyrophosphatase